MAVAFGSTAATGTINNTAPLTFSLTTVSADTRVLVLVGKPLGGTPPSGVTYGGNALTADGNAPQGFNLSVWHIDQPSFTAGAQNVVVSYSDTGDSCAAVAIPLRGANSSIAPVLGTATTGSSASASCTIAGAGANDLQLAQCMVVSTTMTSAGAPQSVVTAVPTLPIEPIIATYAYSADFLTLGSAGNFGWTLTSGTWNAWALRITAAAAGGGGTPGVGGMINSGKWVWSKRR